MFSPRTLFSADDGKFFFFLLCQLKFQNNKKIPVSGRLEGGSDVSS